MSARGRDLATRMVDLPATALRTLEHLVGSVVLSSGPDGFRLGDVTLASLLARYSGAVSQTSVATIFDDTGRLTACTRVSGPEWVSPGSARPGLAVALARRAILRRTPRSG